MEQQLIPARLAQLEDQIADSTASIAKRSWLIGEALREIQDNEMFSARGFQSIHEYAAVTWGYQRSQCYKLIQMADVCDNLKELESPWIPSSVRQALPLVRLKPNEQLQVANRLFSEETVVTENVVASVAKQVAPWRSGHTSDPEVAQRRYQKRLKMRIEKAVKILALENDPITYRKAIGIPEGLDAAILYLERLRDG